MWEGKKYKAPPKGKVKYKKPRKYGRGLGYNAQTNIEKNKIRSSKKCGRGKIQSLLKTGRGEIQSQENMERVFWFSVQS